MPIGYNGDGITATLDFWADYRPTGGEKEGIPAVSLLAAPPGREPYRRASAARGGGIFRADRCAATPPRRGWRGAYKSKESSPA